MSEYEEINQALDLDDGEELDENEADETDKEKALTPEEHLESILYQFVTLYERWSEDRQVAAKQGAIIAKFVKEFAAEVEKFSKIEDAVIARLRDSLQRTTVSISAMVHDAVFKSIDKHISDSCYKIKESVHHAESLFKEYQSTLNWSHWKTVAITAVISATASLFAVWWFMPKPTLPLTDQQIKAYQAGQVLQSFWPKLSERQQQWLGNLALGKSNNREKLVQDKKTQFPDLSDAQANELTPD